MIVGATDADKAFADHLRRSAKKFGMAIKMEKAWTFDTDLRDSTMDEVPRFTQGLGEHDVVLVADPTDDFGRYVLHNTWLPRPVAGTHGLHAEAWASVIEACARLLKPGGRLFLSTLNRTPAAFGLAIVGAEYLLRLLPRGTHRYAQFIRPSELAGAIRAAGLELEDVSGLHYNPLTRSATVGGHAQVNYLACARKPGAPRG
jgi:SAM-dependent methyltransferase